MVKVVYNDKLVYNVYIWVLFGIIFGKEREDLKYEQLLQVQLKKVNWRIVYAKCVFWHKLVIHKYQLSFVSGVTFKGNVFPFIKLLSMFCTIFISIVINSKNINLSI